MLAWVHQAAAAEADFLAALAGDSLDKGVRSELLTAEFADVGPALRVRLLQAASQGGGGPVRSPKAMESGDMSGIGLRGQSARASSVPFRISALATFYRGMLEPLFGSGGALMETLASCAVTARNRFEAAYREHTQWLSRAVLQPSADLAPPGPYADAVALLGELLASYASSLGSASAATNEADFATGFAPLLDMHVEAMLKMLDSCGKRLQPVENAVLACNTLSMLDDMLRRHTTATTATKGHRGALEDRTEAHMEELVQGEAWSVLAHCGLGDVLRTVQGATVDGASAAGAPLAAAAPSPVLRPALVAFYASLGSLELRHVENMSDPALRKRARGDVAQLILESYNVVVRAVRHSSSGFSAAEADSLLTQSVEDVRILLGF